MKKYVKPELILEHYELSNTIADCAFELQSSDKNSCVAQGDTEDALGGVVLFLDSSMGCKYDPKIFEFYCYQNGSSDGGANVFNS
jgi:hypothetical protein